MAERDHPYPHRPLNLAQAYADVALGYHQRLPKLEAELDETKGVAMRVEGQMTETRHTLRRIESTLQRVEECFTSQGITHETLRRRIRTVESNLREMGRDIEDSSVHNLKEIDPATIVQGRGSWRVRLPKGRALVKLLVQVGVALGLGTGWVLHVVHLLAGK